MTKRCRMLLDTDCVGDDILAIFYAAKHPAISLEGVTVVAGAAGPIDHGVKVALHTLEVAERTDVPVFRGIEQAIVGHPPEIQRKPVDFAYELEATLGKEKLKGFNPPPPEPVTKPQSQHAVDYIIELVRENPGEITLVTTGPLTNVALAFAQEPSLPQSLKQLIIMGGSFFVPGNITPVVEYNVWADPEAARVVFNAPAKKIVVPLDVCENNAFSEGMLTRDVLVKLGEVDTPVTEKIRSMFPVYIDIWRDYFGLVGFPLDDVIAVALAVDPDLGRLTHSYVDVELEGELTRGQTVLFRGKQICAKPGPNLTHVCLDLDAAGFMWKFVETMKRA